MSDKDPRLQSVSGPPTPRVYSLTPEEATVFRAVIRLHRPESLCQNNAAYLLHSSQEDQKQTILVIYDRSADRWLETLAENYGFKRYDQGLNNLRSTSDTSYSTPCSSANKAS
jgi:hypothetical protein